MKPGGVVLLMASLGSCRDADPQQADVAPVVVASASFNKDVASILFVDRTRQRTAFASCPLLPIV
jgi:hypothetical protein